jgi:hypothetical protein
MPLAGTEPRLGMGYRGGMISGRRLIIAEDVVEMW